MDFIVEHPIVCIVIFLTILTFLWLITEVIWVMLTNKNPLIYLFWQELFPNKIQWKKWVYGKIKINEDDNVTAFEKISVGNKFTLMLPNNIIVVAVKLSNNLSRTIQIRIPHYLEMPTTQKVVWDKTKKDEVWELKNFVGINPGQKFLLPNVQENGTIPMSLIKASETEAQTLEDPPAIFPLNTNEKIIILKE